MKQVVFVIASHSYLINKGLSLIINELKNAKVSEITESVSSLEKSLTTNRPDYLLITDELLKGTGKKQLNSILKKSPSTKIVLIKTSGKQIIRYKLHYEFDLLSGKKETTGFFVNLLEKDMQTEGEYDREISERERMILRLVALGKTNKEIADELFLSKHTVITHRKNITGKLGIKSISGLTVYALINGLISLEEVEK